MKLFGAMVTEKFYMDVPTIRYKDLQKSIKKLVWAYRKLNTWESYKEKFELRSIEGVKGPIFKHNFSSNLHDWIIFAILKDEKMGDSLVFLKYLDQNKPGLKSNELSETRIVYFMDQELLSSKDLEQSELTTKVSELTLEGLRAPRGLQWKHLQDSAKQPYIIDGEYGSGKTTLVTYKLLNFAHGSRVKNYRGLCYTISKKASQAIEKTFSRYNMNDDVSVDFMSFDQYALRYGYEAPITFQQFDRFYHKYVTTYLNEIFEFQLNIRSVWEEIENYIKGGMGHDFKRSEYLKNEVALKLEDYLEITEDISDFSEDERHFIYQFAVETYENWLNEYGQKDRNDMIREFHIHETEQQYDFIVIDDAHVLSEIELYFLQSLLKSKKKHNIFVAGNGFSMNKRSGEMLSTISRQLADKRDSQIEIQTLKKSIRSARQIMGLVNSVVKLSRQSYAPLDKTEYETNISHGFIKYLSFDKNNQKKLFRHIGSKKIEYMSIVTPDSATKAKLLLSYPFLRHHTFTVDEMRGVESRYILCYNMVMSDKDRWSRIIQASRPLTTQDSECVDKYITAVTRAAEIVFIIEDETHIFYHNLKQLGVNYDVIDIFTNDLFDRKVNAEISNYRELADQCLSENNLKQASELFMKSKDFKKAVECRLQYLEAHGDIKEVEETSEFVIENCESIDEFMQLNEKFNSMGHDMVHVMEGLSPKTKFHYLDMAHKHIEKKIREFDTLIEKANSEKLPLRRGPYSGGHDIHKIK